MKIIPRSIAWVFVFLVVLGTAASLLLDHSEFLLPFYTAVTNLILGLSIIYNNPRNKANVSFFVVTISIVVWTTSIFLYWQMADPALALWCSKTAYMSTSFIPAFLVYFSMVYPYKEKKMSLFLKTVIFAPIPILLLMTLSNLIVNGVEKLPWGYNLLTGRCYLLFTAYFVVYMVWALIALLLKALRYVGMARLQIIYVFIGFFAGSLPPIITNLILPQYGNTILTNIGPSFTILFVACTAYAITKHHLMDISIVISRFLAELLTVALYVSTYLGLVWLFKQIGQEDISWIFVLMTIAMGVIVGQTHQTIRIFIQTTSDKIFLRGKYDYYKELSDATARVGEKMSLAEILKVLYSTFTNVIEISNPRIFLPEYFSDNEKSSKAYVIYDKASFQPLMAGMTVPFDSKWLKTMIDKRVPLHEIKEIDAFLVVPCFVEERLIGFFALGRKLSEDAYTDEDLRLLRALANQAAMALDHTRSYEKIRTDLESVERQLERSQRLASLGTLTAGVTHEIRNPLTVIRGETERLANQPRDAEYLVNFRDLLLKHIDRISGIVNRMLDLAKEKPKQKTMVDLNESINSTLPLLSWGTIKVVKELKASRAINGDPEELQEVFINLLQNAIDAMPHGGVLTIKTYEENNRTVVAISDTGKGIPPEIREKIFDPFFSSRHEGVGLGLSIAYRIVREHDGDISVESEVGKGSTFKLEF